MFLHTHCGDFVACNNTLVALLKSCTFLFLGHYFCESMNFQENKECNEIFL